MRLAFRHAHALVGQRRTADLLEVIELHHQPLAHPKEIGDGIERRALAALGALAVTGVQEGQPM